MSVFDGYTMIDADDIKTNDYPVFPAGMYYVGDLCGALNDDDFDTVVERVGWVSNWYYRKDNSIIGYCSTGDDGVFEDTLGRIYGVDAENISIVPAHLVSIDDHVPALIPFKNDFQFFHVDNGEHDTYIQIKDMVDPSNSFRIIIKGAPSSEDEEEEEEDYESFMKFVTQFAPQFAPTLSK